MNAIRLGALAMGKGVELVKVERNADGDFHLPLLDPDGLGCLLSPEAARALAQELVKAATMAQFFPSRSPPPRRQR
jgi:hypothetical protein